MEHKNWTGLEQFSTPNCQDSLQLEKKLKNAIPYHVLIKGDVNLTKSNMETF